MKYQIEFNEEEFHHQLAQKLTKLFYCVGQLREGKKNSRRYIHEIQTTLDAITHESRERRIVIKRSKEMSSTKFAQKLEQRMLRVDRGDEYDLNYSNSGNSLPAMPAKSSNPLLSEISSPVVR